MKSASSVPVPEQPNLLAAFSWWGPNVIGAAAAGPPFHSPQLHTKPWTETPSSHHHRKKNGNNVHFDNQRYHCCCSILSDFFPEEQQTQLPAQSVWIQFLQGWTCLYAPSDAGRELVLWTEVTLGWAGGFEMD